MTTNPYLPNHLIRELMHTIRVKKSGEAMVLLALSGKEPFSVFRYVVETYMYASAERDDICLRCSSPVWFSTVSLDFLTEGFKRLAYRFVRELYVKGPPSKQFPFEKIVELKLYSSFRFDDFTFMLSSWTDIEVLTIDDLNYGFLKDAVNGTVLLTNLTKFDARLTFYQFTYLMSSTSRFPLAEDVTLHFGIENNNLSDLPSLNTFPKVKRFTANIWFGEETCLEKLHGLPTILKCFTSLETAKIDVSCDHYSFPNDLVELEKFNEWLRDTKFTASVEINLNECVDVASSEDPESIYEQLKSVGYEEHYCETDYAITKDYGNVKFFHCIEHFDTLTDKVDDSSDGISDLEFGISDSDELGDDVNGDD